MVAQEVNDRETNTIDTAAIDMRSVGIMETSQVDIRAMTTIGHDGDLIRGGPVEKGRVAAATGRHIMIMAVVAAVVDVMTIDTIVVVGMNDEELPMIMNNNSHHHHHHHHIIHLPQHPLHP